MTTVNKIVWNANNTDYTEVATKVKVGDWVGFKCDIEQYGQITKISGNTLHLRNNSGFEGGYIGGNIEHTESASDCYLD